VAPEVGVSTTEVVQAWCERNGVEWEQTAPGFFVVVLPGEQKLRTNVSLSVGPQTLVVNAFVIRHPDENTAAVHQWLLERNQRIYGMAYAVDHLGDIFLVGTLPISGITEDVIDQLMGSVLLHSDQAFNTLLEMGFGEAIRAEWRWRLAAGESTANLAAFTHLAPSGTEAADAGVDPGPTDNAGTNTAD